MTTLICETTKGLNNLQSSIIAFFAVMSIIGFMLIYIDKKRWKEHTNRSAEMMGVKRTAGDVENENEPKSGGKKRKTKNSTASTDFEYEGRIKDRVLILMAIFFCGVGELLGMLICRHKWYKIQYKIGIPLIALLNIGFVVIIVLACAGITSGGYQFSA